MAMINYQSKQTITMPAPLFDRLVDENPRIQEEAIPFKAYTIEETAQSISQELHNLLNTRTSAIPYSIYATREDLNSRDVSNRYGLPDFSKFDIAEGMAAQRLARQIRRLVEHYESRLSNVSVKLIGLDNNQRLMLEISAIINTNPSRQRFTFPIAIDLSQGE